MSDSEETLDDENKPQNWDEWEEDDANEEKEPTRSLFSSTVLPSVEAALEHDRAQFGFDLRAYKEQASLSDYDVIKCINFIRLEVAAGRDPLPQLSIATTGSQPWSDDKYLQPALDEDPLLCYDFEDEAEHREEAAAGVAGAEELARLRDENAALRSALEELALATMPEELRQAAEPGEEAMDSDAAGPSTSASPASAQHAQHAAAVRRVDKSYFDAYSGFEIHRTMLGDKARTEAYMRALERNPALLRGRVVLDVGCGTSILSMFAARGGAARVLGVDGSSTIAGIARQVLATNSLGSEAGGPVTILAGKLEEMKQLPVEKVDVIVSEWMGYALLFESMLDTVLHARDRYLAPGGAMLPDLARIHIAGAAEAALGLDFWKDVYGFSMAPIASQLREAALRRGVVCEVDSKHVVTDTCTVKELDLCTMAPGDQDFTAPFKLLPSAGAPHAELGTIVLWFDTEFSSRFCREEPVLLSTSPFQPKTHWVQTLLLLRQPVPLGAQGAQEITGRFSMARDPASPRSLDITLEYTAVLADGTSISGTGIYNMDILADE